MGHELVLWKEPGHQGRWSCFDNACPHRCGAELSHWAALMRDDHDSHIPGVSIILDAKPGLGCACMPPVGHDS